MDEGWGGGHSACWLHPRDNPGATQTAATYFDETLEGKHCSMNWFEGNKGLLGLQGRPPTFVSDAPALFGVDSDIGTFCHNKMRREGTNPGVDVGHAGTCVAAGVNILNVFTDRVPYNICRNLEWQVCSAQGLLPGQGGNGVLFATAPSSVNPKPGSRRPLGKCSGWKPKKKPSGGYGYTNDDIFFLEACLFSQLCDNGHDIFMNAYDQNPFHCEFSAERFRELEKILLVPATGRPVNC